jgi:hypothetical protein
MQLRDDEAYQGEHQCQSDQWWKVLEPLYEMLPPLAADIVREKFEEAGMEVS